jgi:hypothetical protein
VHLVQLNVGYLKHPADDPRLADFMAALDVVNAVAERSPGFIWRMKDETGNAMAIRRAADPNMILNMSLWRSVAELEQFVWKTVHERVYRKRGDWFDKMDKPHLVMWWVEEGHIPTTDEAMERLDRLHKHGPTEFAFGWEQLSDAKFYRTGRCG